MMMMKMMMKKKMMMTLSCGDQRFYFPSGACTDGM